MPKGYPGAVNQWTDTTNAKKDQGTNNDLQNIASKDQTKISRVRNKIPITFWIFYGKIYNWQRQSWHLKKPNRSMQVKPDQISDHVGPIICISNSGGIRRLTILTNPVISHEWGQNRTENTSNGTHSWLFLTQKVHSDWPSRGGDHKTVEVLE
jgi:hypothetical protein